MTDTRPIYDLSMEEVFATYRTSRDGLNDAEVLSLREQYGYNRLPARETMSVWTVILHQFKSPLIYVLGAAGLMALAMGDTTDAGFIGVVLLINALIGTWQEWRAEQGMKALEKFLHIRARVLRNKDVVTVDAEELVPGDVLLLESGQRIPADVRLASAKALEVDESMLTGESLAVIKDENWKSDAASTVGDRLNMGYAGTTVVKGRARAVVIATGTNTELGRLADNVMQSGSGKPPLVLRMERFAQIVAIVVLVIAVAIGMVGVFFQGYSWTDAFMLIVALAVSAIPEGLPVGMTVALSVATSRMAKRNVIVRRLQAVEGLGSCTYIATDKTGTLTVNALTVARVWTPNGREYEVSGEGFEPNGQVVGADRSDETLIKLVTAGVLCNEGELSQENGEWSHLGDPTDIALHVLAEKLGTDRTALVYDYIKVEEIPFEPELRYAATFHEISGTIHASVKGGPERIIGMCAMDEAGRQAALDQADHLAKSGYRVIALARGNAIFSVHEEPSELEFLGYVGMIDPLRSGVKEAIRECHSAGLKVAMVTGDHPATALAIARDMGIAEREDQVMTGVELQGKSSEEIAAMLDRIQVFARVAPEQKLHIVRAARQAGHFVAVTGDGVNDAPALQEANIGVAMGKDGTDVAREASELVITDDNFASIVGGIEEGRIAYDNIRKVIYLLISTGTAELILIGMAVFAGLPLPLLPVQLLWLNLVTNGIQDVALAFEPGEKGVMARKPRSPNEPIFDRLMIERTLSAAVVMAFTSFGLFYYLLEQGWAEGEARNMVLLLMVLFECVHIGNCRSEYQSAFKLSPLRAPILLGGTLTAMTLHIISMHIPFMQNLLGTSPVSLEWWGVLALMSLSVLVIIEIHKYFVAHTHAEHVDAPWKKS